MSFPHIFGRKDIFMSNTFGDAVLFTSESVCAGHPDKICDSIADSILDAYLAHDKNSRVAIEVMGGHNLVTINGEVTSRSITKSKVVLFNFSW